MAQLFFTNELINSVFLQTSHSPTRNLFGKPHAAAVAVGASLRPHWRAYAHTQIGQLAWQN